MSSWQAVEYTVGSPAGYDPERHVQQWTGGAKPVVSSGSGALEVLGELLAEPARADEGADRRVAGEVEGHEARTGGCPAGDAGTAPAGAGLAAGE